MARLINIDAALDRYYAEWASQDICSGEEDRDWLMKCFNEAPEIETEPVVYCKNCLHLQSNPKIDYSYCNIVDAHVNPKNFCCWGEENQFRKKSGK